jgi:hypothetical protein
METAMVLVHRATLAEARPITAHRHDQVELIAVQVKSDHPLQRNGIVYLSPDQLDCVHGELTTLAPGKYGRFDCGSGAEVRQMRHDDSSIGEDVVCIRSEHPFGSGECCMTEHEARYIRSRLAQIAIAFLHENVWGGEDALVQ